MASLSTEPAQQPPPGVASNLSAYNPHLATAIAGIVVVEVVCVAIVGMRLFTQYVIASGMVVEDFVIFVAILLQAGLHGLAIVCVQHDAGKHLWNVSLYDFSLLVKPIVLLSIFHGLTVAFIKIAILLQLIRIFALRIVSKPTWIVCWISIVMNVIYYTLSTIFMGLVCPSIGHGHAVLREERCLGCMQESAAIWNVFSDLVILTIPMPLVFRLNMSTRKKLSIAAVFLTGFFACVASIVRLAFTWKESLLQDMTYHLYAEGVACTCETLAGILIFCMPKLPQFYQFVRSRMGSNSTAPSPSASDVPSDLVEKAVPRSSKQTFEMPSLASFEGRESHLVNQTIQPSVLGETAHWPPDGSQSSSSNSS